MSAQQGDLDLLNDPVATELLHSRIPARLAYTWTDGTPRVVPIWFHWNGREVVLASPAAAPKAKALARNPHVALTIDSESWPPKVLMIRGTAVTDTVEGVSPEYAAAAERYFGEEQGRQWVEQVRSGGGDSVRVRITPSWVGIIDFETRFPSALSI